MFAKFETANLPNSTGDKVLYVEKNCVTGIEEVTQKITAIFTTGHQCFHVKGSVDEVMAKLIG